MRKPGKLTTAKPHGAVRTPESRYARARVLDRLRTFEACIGENATHCLVALSLGRLVPNRAEHACNSEYARDLGQKHGWVPSTKNDSSASLLSPTHISIELTQGTVEKGPTSTS